MASPAGPYALVRVSECVTIGVGVYQGAVDSILVPLAVAVIAIVPDLLTEEAAPMSEICKREDFSLIQLVTPMTPKDRALKIAETSTGFLYYVSVVGSTGERTQLPPELVENVSWLRSQTDLPICIGFGINQPEHVKLLGPVSDGLIVGSAIVKRIANVGEEGTNATLKSVGEYADQPASMGDAGSGRKAPRVDAAWPGYPDTGQSVPCGI